MTNKALPNVWRKELSMVVLLFLLWEGIPLSCALRESRWVRHQMLRTDVTNVTCGIFAPPPSMAIQG